MRGAIPLIPLRVIMMRREISWRLIAFSWRTVLCGCEILRDGRKAGSQRAFGKISGPTKGTTNERFWILHNEEFCSSYKDNDTLCGLNKLWDGGPKSRGFPQRPRRLWRSIQSVLVLRELYQGVRLVDWRRGYGATTPSHPGRKLAGPLCTAFSSARQPQRRSTKSDMRALWQRGAEMGEKWPTNFAWKSEFYLISRVFNMPQICDMGETALLPFRRKARWGFFRPKIPTASAGFEPGTRGRHANH
jgi:hypothetical protein